MTEEDIAHIRGLLADGEIPSPILELGAGYGGKTCKELVESTGLEYYGTDLTPAKEVNFIADFEDAHSLQVFGERKFGSIFILNVLEHTFDPIKILDNAARLLRPGGCIVTLTPCMWPIHNYPIDCVRLLPDWYREYARRRKSVRLREKSFHYVGLGPIANYATGHEPRLPGPWRGRYQEIYSKAVHKLFNTTGRTQWSKSHLAICAIFDLVE
jgi:SAM-dependent methyltransferase